MRRQGFTSKVLNSKTKTNKLKGKALAPLGPCWRSQGIASRPLTQAAVHLVYSWAKAAQIPNTSLAKSGKILWTLTTLQVIFLSVLQETQAGPFITVYDLLVALFVYATGHAIM